MEMNVWTVLNNELMNFWTGKMKEWICGSIRFKKKSSVFYVVLFEIYCCILHIIWPIKNVHFLAFSENVIIYFKLMWLTQALLVSTRTHVKLWKKNGQIYITKRPLGTFNGVITQRIYTYKINGKIWILFNWKCFFSDKYFLTPETIFASW